MRSGKGRARRATLALTMAALVTLAVPASAHAYWIASAPALSAQLDTAEVASPTSVSCSSSGVLTNRRANVTWAAVPDAASYNVIISSPDGTVSGHANTSNTSIALTGTLLNNLLGGLIAVLFGSGTATVSIETVHTSGWVSPPSENTVLIGRSGLLIDGLLGGVECK